MTEHRTILTIKYKDYLYNNFERIPRPDLKKQITVINPQHIPRTGDVINMGKASPSYFDIYGVTWEYKTSPIDENIVEETKITCILTC